MMLLLEYFVQPKVFVESTVINVEPNIVYHKADRNLDPKRKCKDMCKFAIFRCEQLIVLKQYSNNRTSQNSNRAHNSHISAHHSNRNTPLRIKVFWFFLEPVVLNEVITITVIKWEDQNSPGYKEHSKGAYSVVEVDFGVA